MKPYNPKVRIAKKISSAIALFFIGLVGYAIYFTMPEPVVTPPKPEPTPTCNLQCLVAERAEEIHKRDQQKYLDQARLQALIEIQDELHEITLNLNN